MTAAKTATPKPKSAYAIVQTDLASRKKQLDDAKAKKAEFTAQGKKRADFAEKGSAKLIDKRRAELLDEPTVEAPTRSEIDEAQSDAAALQAACDGLDPLIAALEGMVKAQETTAAKATLKLLEDKRAPHVLMVATLLNMLHGSMVNLMAIDHLSNFEFADPNAPLRNWTSQGDLFGPAGVLRERLIGINWLTWPYSLRPSWAQPNGQHAPQLAPGLDVAMAAVRAEIEMEKAA